MKIDFKHGGVLVSPVKGISHKKFASHGKILDFFPLYTKQIIVICKKYKHKLQ
jgi:hypothetical protein